MPSWLFSKVPGLGGSAEKDALSEAIQAGRRVRNELDSIQQDLAKDQARADAASSFADGASSGVGDGGSGFSFGDFGGFSGGGDIR